MKGFFSLASGSKGNCIYLGTSDAKILIDAGISGKMIQKRLSEINVDLSEIDAVVITHEHLDHIQGLKVLSGKKKIPIFCNADTAKGICESLKITPQIKIFSTGESFSYKDLEFHPFSIQHDTLDPVGFTIRYGAYKLGFCTDLGFVTSLVINQLKECDYLYLEANHHPTMVHSSARPSVYKRRVLGRQGHLSNQECADLLLKILHSKLKHVHLAHLSSECNSEEIALKTIKDALGSHQIDVSIAKQTEPSKKIYF